MQLHNGCYSGIDTLLGLGVRDLNLISTVCMCPVLILQKTLRNGKEGPLLVHVGRLGAEKNIKAIKGMMEAIPNCCLAIVGGCHFSPT